MATIINLNEISAALKQVDLIMAMKNGFIAYSNQQTVIPPVGELLFDQPKGEAHIKYGYIKDDPFYCIKIASGFYNNQQLGISSSQGMLLLFNQQTGVPEAILLDQGKLTNIRTAVTGAMVAQYFAPKQINAIGIIGTGIQAELQLEYLLQQTTCKIIWIWGRNTDNAEALKNKLDQNLTVHIAKNTSELSRNCNLIVTTTPSEHPLLFADDIQPGTHITAVGSDTATKQELASDILNMADIVIADSISQSENRGEIFQAVTNNSITKDKVIELGVALQTPSLQRINDQQVTVVDLTGVAIQDIMIAKAVYTAIKNRKN